MYLLLSRYTLGAPGGNQAGADIHTAFPLRKCWIFVAGTTSHGELLVEKFFFMKDAGPWEAPTLELRKSVRRKECQKGTVMTSAMTPACYNLALPAVLGEEVEEQSGIRK